jgi:hypothetical protein
MSNNLTDAARKAYQRRRVYIPEWMQLAQWVAIFIIPIVIAISFVIDKNKPINPQQIAITTNENNVNSSLDNLQPNSDQLFTLLKKSSGSTAKIPSEALETGILAANAMWTGDWSSVPVTGTPPSTGSIFPDLVLGTPKIYSMSDAAIIFVFPLDVEGDGKVDQTFQVSVINEGGRWLFPSVSG